MVVEYTFLVVDQIQPPKLVGRLFVGKKDVTECIQQLTIYLVVNVLFQRLNN